MAFGPFGKPPRFQATPATACRTCRRSSTPARLMPKRTPISATSGTTRPSGVFGTFSANTAATSALPRRTTWSAGPTSLRGTTPRPSRFFRTVHERYGHPAALYRIASLSVRKDREVKGIAAYADFARRYPPDTAWPTTPCGRPPKPPSAKANSPAPQRSFGRLAEQYPQTDFGDEARWNTGFALYCQEQYSEALAAFERAGQQARQPHIIDQSLYWAGKSAERLGRTEDATAFYRRAAAGFPRSYYSARAVLLGHKEQVQLEKRPTDDPRQDDVPALAHRVPLERAGLLNQLGLRDWSAAEMEQAVLDYKGNKTALKAIRDYYEALGYRDQAMRLSMRLFDGQDPEELSRISTRLTIGRRLQQPRPRLKSTRIWSCR